MSRYVQDTPPAAAVPDLTSDFIAEHRELIGSLGYALLHKLDEDTAAMLRVRATSDGVHVARVRQAAAALLFYSTCVRTGLDSAPVDLQSCIDSFTSGALLGTTKH